MNRIAKLALATRAGFNSAIKSARIAYRNPQRFTGSPQNFYEAGRRWQWGDRSWIWSWVTDARFDATQADRWEMMRKARYFEANSPLVQRLADLWEQYTVGANGLLVSPQTDAEAWVDSARLWYDDWSAAPELTSRLSLAVLQSLASRLWFVDGEVFILKTRTTTAPYRPKIQLIESHRVGTPPSMRAQEGFEIIDGIEIDGKGRPIAYWVRDGLQGDTYTRISAENMIHVYEPSRVGMMRGLTHFYAVMNPLHDLDDLMRLEMSAAKEAARTKKLIFTKSGEMPQDDWDEQENDSGDDRNPRTSYYESVFGGETKVLFKGDDYKEFVSNRPSVAQQWYWKFLIEQVCSGVGIPLVLVFPDTMQGTVYRGAQDTAAIFFRSRSKVLSDAFVDVWRYVMGFAAQIDPVIRTGRPADWMLASVRPPRSVNVDVGRNSAAMLAELQAGVRTFQDIYAETGDDWKQKIEQRAREAQFVQKMATKYAVEPSFITSFAVAQMKADQAARAKPQQQVTQ